MNPFCKSFIVISVIVLTTIFMPTELSQATIFGGTEIDGQKIGFCLAKVFNISILKKESEKRLAF